MHLTAPDLKGLGLVDEVIAEPSGGAHLDHAAAAASLAEAIGRHLDELAGLAADDLLEGRYRKFRSFGEWIGK